MSKSLGSALVTILLSVTVCVILMVAAAIITDQGLYYVAAGLFAVSGVAGVYVVRALQKKIGR